MFTNSPDFSIRVEMFQRGIILVVMIGMIAFGERVGFLSEKHVFLVLACAALSIFVVKLAILGLALKFGIRMIEKAEAKVKHSEQWSLETRAVRLTFVLPLSLLIVIILSDAIHGGPIWNLTGIPINMLIIGLAVAVFFSLAIETKP